MTFLVCVPLFNRKLICSFFINGVVAHTQKKDFKVDVLSQINGQKIALFSKEQRPIFGSFGPLKRKQMTKLGHF